MLAERKVLSRREFLAQFPTEVQVDLIRSDFRSAGRKDLEEIYGVKIWYYSNVIVIENEGRYYMSEGR